MFAEYESYRFPSLENCLHFTFIIFSDVSWFFFFLVLFMLNDFRLYPGHFEYCVTKILKVKVKSLSCVRLFATPWPVAYQASQSKGFSRQECWSGLPFPSPGDLPDPGIEPWGVHGAGGAWGDAPETSSWENWTQPEAQIKSDFDDWPLGGTHVGKVRRSEEHSTDRTDVGPTAHRRLTGTWGWT